MTCSILHHFQAMTVSDSVDQKQDMFGSFSLQGFINTDLGRVGYGIVSSSA